jgi:hypothetical protein
LAEETRAPVASCTVPRSDPRGFWAWRVTASRVANRVRRSAVWQEFRFMFLGKSETRLERELLPEVVG